MTGWTINPILDAIISWLMKRFIRKTLNLLWQILAATLFHLPNVTTLPQVEALSRRSLFVVNTVYVLIVIVAGIAIMTRGGVQDRYGPGELLPRLVVGLSAANLATPLTRFIIRASNTLVMALTGQGFATDDALGQLKILIFRQLTNSTSALLMAIIGLTLILLVVMLIVGWVTRFIALVMLCGLAPVALACHGTPWTEAIATLWWRVLGGIVATVVLQAVALNTALSILLDPRSNHSMTPNSVDPTGLLNLFLVACLLWFTARIPSYVGQVLSQRGSRNSVFGAIVRLVIVQQLTRGLGRGIRTTLTRRGTAIDQVEIPYGKYRSGSATSARTARQRSRTPSGQTRTRGQTHTGGQTQASGQTRSGRKERPAFMDGVTPLTAFGRPGEQKRPTTTWTPPNPRTPPGWRHPGTRWAPQPGSSPPPPRPPSHPSVTWGPVDPARTPPRWAPPDDRTPPKRRPPPRTPTPSPRPARPARPAPAWRPPSNWRAP